MGPAFLCYIVGPHFSRHDDESLQIPDGLQTFARTLGEEVNGVWDCWLSSSHLSQRLVAHSVMYVIALWEVERLLGAFSAMKCSGCLVI